jgi:hypothetical protein
MIGSSVDPVNPFGIFHSIEFYGKGLSSDADTLAATVFRKARATVDGLLKQISRREFRLVRIGRQPLQ